MGVVASALAYISGAKEIVERSLLSALKVRLEGREGGVELADWRLVHRRSVFSPEVRLGGREGGVELADRRLVHRRSGYLYFGEPVGS